MNACTDASVVLLCADTSSSKARVFFPPSLIDIFERMEHVVFSRIRVGCNCCKPSRMSKEEEEALRGRSTANREKEKSRIEQTNGSTSYYAYSVCNLVSSPQPWPHFFLLEHKNLRDQPLAKDGVRRTLLSPF